MNLSVVIIYSIVDFIIHALSSSLRPFDGKRRVSALIESFRPVSMSDVTKEFFFELSNLSSVERSEWLFQSADRSHKVGLGSLEKSI